MPMTMGSPMFTAVLLAVLISACLSDDAITTAGKVENSPVIALSSTSNVESATAESTTNSTNTSKPSKSGDSVKPQQVSNALDSGVYTRAFCVLVALGGLVIIYLAVKAFWRTRRARAAAAAQNKSSINIAATSRRSASASDRSGLMAADDEEEDEESTVFDQSRERLLKASARKS